MWNSLALPDAPSLMLLEGSCCRVDMWLWVTWALCHWRVFSTAWWRLEAHGPDQDVRSPGLPGERDLREPLGKTGILKGGKDVDNKAGKGSRKERGKLAFGLLKPWICHLENSKAYLGRITCPASSLVQDARWSRLSVPCPVFRLPSSIQVGPQHAGAVLWSRACG